MPITEINNEPDGSGVSASVRCTPYRVKQSTPEVSQAGDASSCEGL